MILKNKKGMTLMEMMVVVIVIAGLIALAYPTYLSALEKARALEAVQLASHLVAAQEKFVSDCYSMDNSGVCSYATDFRKLPIEISGSNKASKITVAATTITTPNFVYTMSGGGIIATPRSGGYKYTLTAPANESVIYCKITDATGKKICSAIGKPTADANTFKID